MLRNSLQPAIQVVNEWCFRYSLLKCVEFAASFQLNGCPFLRSFSFSILIFFSHVHRGLVCGFYNVLALDLCEPRLPKQRITWRLQKRQASSFV